MNINKSENLASDCLISPPGQNRYWTEISITSGKSLLLTAFPSPRCPMSPQLPSNGPESSSIPPSPAFFLLCLQVPEFPLCSLQLTAHVNTPFPFGHIIRLLLNHVTYHPCTICCWQLAWLRRWLTRWCICFLLVAHMQHHYSYWQNTWLCKSKDGRGYLL